MPPPQNPVLVEVHRGAQVESRHRGAAVAVDAANHVVFAIGHTEQWIYPRSALKPFQAIPLVESGAAAHFNLSAAEIALACASHSGEDLHLRAVAHWLRRLGLDGEALECGAELPLMGGVARKLLARGEQPSRMHHNCSGKHAGMLSLASFMQAPLRGYSDYHHPTQQAWMQTLSELVELEVSSLPWERDGCGVPAICMPLTKLAQAFAQYANLPVAAPQHGKATGNPKPIGGARGDAMRRILDAVRAHPQMFAGAQRCCTEVIRASNGEVFLKTGAEGVYGGGVPHLGVGFALKIEDGATRAANVALGALLQKLGALKNVHARDLAQHFQPTLTNSNGKVIGKIVPSQHWTQELGSHG